ncbi:MAG: uracil-DNA glycosylase [Tannerella sp.]|jgi:uracil-DNA glycosylase|nr:uracil-DNA glycosylase [Tannerella sp.]
MDIKIEQSWKEQLAGEFQKTYFKQLTEFVRQAYQQTTVYPRGKHIFNAFDHCPFEKVKVVLLGQDPYHEPGQAHGLCFSVQDGIPFPPSLVNIFKEIESDIRIPVPQSGDLTRWADQGVLLLNSTLTVRAHSAGSHQRKGWETFTDAVIDRLNTCRYHIVYLLWGSYAQQKGSFINASRNLVLKSAHPSPLSAYRGFFGNRHFSQANDYLTASGQTPIIW